jgi:hypothetical protein
MNAMAAMTVIPAISHTLDLLNFRDVMAISTSLVLEFFGNENFDLHHTARKYPNHVINASQIHYRFQQKTLTI